MAKSYTNIIGEKENIFGDGIASTKLWDFSRANVNEESRIEAITRVASVCYANPNAVGKESLYNRLKAESIGLPSSSFEFIPVLIQEDDYFNTVSWEYDTPHMQKYGQFIEHDDVRYLLTNYRAVLFDQEDLSIDWGDVDFTQHFNTEEECSIIAQHFKVFESKIDIVTRAQYIRHRVSWQELSRRYVSGKKVPFEFYVSEGMKQVYSSRIMDDVYGEEYKISTSTQDLIDMCVDHYFTALENGVQPQEARRIIPQAAYTTVWSAWQPKPLESFFKLRLDHHAQWEIRQLAQAKKDLIYFNQTLI